MNPGLVAGAYDQETQKFWRRTRIAARAHAMNTHKLAEHQDAANHELALIAGMENKLAISPAGTELLRQWERGRPGK
jgi:hypothetical protein